MPPLHGRVLLTLPLQAAQDKVKLLEDQLITERESRKTETSLLSSKVALAEREVSARDSTMLQLRTDNHNLQQVLAFSLWML